MAKKRKVNVNLVLKVSFFIVGVLLMLAAIIVVVAYPNSKNHLILGTVFLIVGMIFSVIAIPIKTNKYSQENKQIK